MGSIDILVREKHQIPEDETTEDWCNKHGLDYGDEMLKAFSEKKKKERKQEQNGVRSM